MTRLSTLQLILLMLCYQLVMGDEAACYSKSVEEPIVDKPGDFIIAGIFNIGEIEETQNPVTNETELSCVLSGSNLSYWSLQRAFSFIEILNNFKPSPGYTLGYKIFTGCNSMVVSRLVSRAISLDDRVTGALLPGYKKHVEPLAGLITAYSIPAISYIYADDDLMDQESYPTMITLLDTEKNEAESIIRYLEKQNYQFIDVWYHDFSSEVAHHIYDNYVLKVGCGRINEYTTSSGMDIDKILPLVYSNTTVNPAKVQLLLFNNKKSARNFLNLTVNQLQWNNTIFMFGYSNGRDSYMDYYLSAIDWNSTVTNTFIFLGSDFLNVQLENFWGKISDPNLLRGVPENLPLLDPYEVIRERRQYSTQKTSWLGFSMSGTSLLAQSLDTVLQQNTKHSCVSELRRRVFEALSTGNYTVSLESTDLGIKFVNRSYSKGYAVKAVTATGNNSVTTLLGYSSHLGIELLNERIPQNLISTQEQRSCSVTCPPGQHRDFLDVVNLPCCWKCLKCPIHYYNNRSDQNKCLECGPNETNSDDYIGCVPTHREFLKISSRYVILGLTCSGLNLIVIICVMVLCIRLASRPVIKAADPAFLVTFLLGLAFGNFGVILSLMKPSSRVCTAEFILNTVFFTLVTSSLELRSMKIYTIFSAANNFRKPRFRGLCTRRGQMVMNTVILIVNLTITVFVVEMGNGWKFELVQEQVHRELYVMCKSGSWLTFLPFIIPGFLFLQTLYFAVIMRNFPHNFRETTSIFAATLIAIFSSAMFLTGYELSPPKNKSVLRAIMIYISVLAFLGSILGPKFVVLIRFRSSASEEKEEISATLHNYCNTVSTKSIRHTGKSMSKVNGVKGATKTNNVVTREASLTISSDSELQVRNASVQEPDGLTIDCFNKSAIV